MIAPQRLDPAPRERARVAPRRKRRKRRAVHPPVVLALGLAALLSIPLLGYVMLTANVTAQSFALARAERTRTALVEETQRLDDRIARLQSPERLANLAAALKLHDPHVYAVVPVPKPKATAAPSGFAFLGWFKHP